MADDRRVHSTIDKLPKELINTVQKMFVDNAWPKDHSGKRPGNPYYQDMADYVTQKGHEISVYAIGRYCRHLRVFAKMKESGQLVEAIMNNIKDGKVSATQKAAAEMITAVIIEQLTGQDELSVKDIKCFAQATKDCTNIVISAEKYIQERLKAKVETTAKEITTIGKEKQISPETLKIIRKKVYGILDGTLG